MEEDNIEEVTYPVVEAGPTPRWKGGMQGSVTEHHVPGIPSDISKHIWELDWFEAYRSCPEWSAHIEKIFVLSANDQNVFNTKAKNF